MAKQIEFTDEQKRELKKLAKALRAAVAAFLAGCAITINTAKEGEAASQSATPTISPTVSIELPRSE